MRTSLPVGHYDPAPRVPDPGSPFDEFSRHGATGDELGLIAIPFERAALGISEAIEIEGFRPVPSDLVTGEPTFRPSLRRRRAQSAAPGLFARLVGLARRGRR